MVKITLLHGDKLGQMDHIQSQIVDLTIADARQATADGATSQYNGKSSSNVNSEGNDRENGNISGENLVSEASQGIRPVTNDESRRRSSESDDDSEEDSSEDEEIKAPLELLGEFLQCVRTSDWENASKLCKMILIYEPDNQLALQFQPVIEEKSQVGVPKPIIVQTSYYEIVYHHLTIHYW